jgi:SPP1 gp7 family putative phage head morphogenesis protein
MKWEQILEQAAKSVYEMSMDGLVNEAMVKAMAQMLMRSVFKGYGKNFDSPGLAETDFEMLRFIEENVFVFSGCKNYNQLKEMSQLLKDEQGNIRPFNEFMADVRKVDATYSVHYAEAEYNHALNSSMMASKWQTIQKEKQALPLLKYIAVQDSHTRLEHAALHGVVRKVDDDFWSMWMPPNGWNCRCDVVQLSSGEETDPDTIAVPQTDKMWHNNVGVNGVLFPEKHPYFKAAGKDKPKVEKEAKALVPKRRKSLTELRKETADIFEKYMPMKVGQVTYSSEISPDDIRLKNETLKALLKEYRPSAVWQDTSLPIIAYNSSGRSYGYIKHAGSMLHTFNAGHKVDERRVTKAAMLDRPKSRVDADKLKQSTTVHEFAHLICIKEHYSYSGIKNDKRVTGFIDNLRSIFLKYSNAVGEADRKGDNEKLNDIFLGGYAQTNLNEFMAEAFTEYKLYSKPSPYAVEVGQLIDKTFKR